MTKGSHGDFICHLQYISLLFPRLAAIIENLQSEWFLKSGLITGQSLCPSSCLPAHKTSCWSQLPRLRGMRYTGCNKRLNPFIHLGAISQLSTETNCEVFREETEVCVCCLQYKVAQLMEGCIWINEHEHCVCV